MYKRKIEKDIRCPLEYGLEVFGGKWNSRIICVLAAKEYCVTVELQARERETLQMRPAAAKRLSTNGCKAASLMTSPPE